MTDTPLIQLEDVSIRHGAHVILQDIQAEVGEGELVYLIGRTEVGNQACSAPCMETFHWRPEKAMYVVTA